MAFDAFLKLDGIAGESADKNHKGEIDVHSFTWGLSDTAGSSGGGGGAGKAVLQNFTFVMPLSKASPNLMLACATGRHLKDATLTCRKAGIELLKIKLQDALVAEYQTGGATTDAAPLDVVSLHFVKIDFIYTVAHTNEQVETAFNVQSGGPV